MDQSELSALEALCIQDCAPACAAACPLHVDVRGVLAELGRGEFDAALKRLKKTLPFPGILGRVCQHPCEAACKRGEAGQPLAIAALERACADHGSPSAAPPRPRPRRSEHVAIIGGGLSGLTAAYDLVRKGYSVCVFEALEPLGGSLWAYPDDVLPHRLIVDELSLVRAAGVEVHLNALVDGQAGLDHLRDEHEAVFVAVGAATTDSFGLALDASGRLALDPVTYATSRAGVFAGGGLCRAPGALSAVHSMADGRRAAVSIDRYLQGVSLTAARAGEEPYESCLYTRTEGRPALPRVAAAAPRQGYQRAEAQHEAQRCLPCNCLECVKVCEYLAHIERYPRKYAREVYNNLSIVKGTRYANQLINACSLCGLCAEVCPTGLDVGALNLAARRDMVAHGRMPPSAHDFALRDMAFSQGEHFRLARNAPGAPASDYVFFPGCQLSASAPGYVPQVHRYLQQALPAGARLGLLLGCCGAPANWAGRADLFDQALAGLRADWQALGRPRVVLACSSCYQVFQQHLPEVAVASLWDLMAERGLPASATRGAGQTVSIHDSCSTRHEAHLQDSVRALLGQLGYQVAELPRSRERTTCCGYGGVQWLAHPEVARKVVERRAQEGAADYVTYCAMCRDRLAQAGKRSMHLLDLIFGADPGQLALRPAPGWSQRHENRARLKRQVLAEIWGETMDDQADYEKLQLIISPEVQARLEARLILVEDLQRVIEFAERTGRKLLYPETGHTLASYKPVSVTYWVEYSHDGQSFVVYNAYSHRMEVDPAQPAQEGPAL